MSSDLGEEGSNNSKYDSNRKGTNTITEEHNKPQSYLKKISPIKILQ